MGSYPNQEGESELAKKGARLSVNSWQRVAIENPVARQMALRNFMLRDLGMVGGVGLRAAYICGPAGVGKTHSIAKREAQWRARGISPIRFRPSNIYELLDHFEEARGRHPLIMEEADIIFRSKPMFEILKQATDPETPDIFHRMKRFPKIGKVSVAISLNVPVVVSTNMDLMENHGWRSDLLADRDALLNRSQPVVVPNDPFALWEWSVYLALSSHLTLNTMIRNPNGGNALVQSNPLEVQARAIDWFTDNVNRLAVISPRTLKQVAQAMGRAYHGDLPPVILEQQLAAHLLLKQRSNSVHIPPKADWASILKAMPKFAPMKEAHDVGVAQNRSRRGDGSHGAYFRCGRGAWSLRGLGAAEARYNPVITATD